MNDGRLMSLDALRGLDMLMIMGFSAVVLAGCALFGYGPDCALARQFEHVEWVGLHVEDLIFPTFLFIAGASWPFSMAKQLERGASRHRLALKIVRRGLSLFVLGLICEGVLKFTSTSFRFGTVLGRIGLAWMFAALTFTFFKWRGRLLVAALGLAGTWALMRYFPAPDAPLGTDPFSPLGNLSCWIDRTLIPGRISVAGSHDNQSFLGVLPAVVDALLGMTAGALLRDGRLPGNRKALVLIAAGLALFGLGWAFSPACPIVKKLWTPTFVLAASGAAMTALGAFYWLIDVRGYRRWTFFFRVIGMNSIAIYVAQSAAHAGFTAVRDFLFGGIAAALPPNWGALILAMGYVAVAWGFLYFLYRHHIFFKV